MPGLVVVRRGSQIGVTSLLSDNPLEPLWLQPVPDHRSGQVLLINSRQLVVCSNFGIQSFHPLTGQLQWSHIWKDSEQLHQLAGQYLKVYSTDSHIILLPSLGKARETARTVVCASNLRQVGWFSAPSSMWRDLAMYGAFVYVSSEMTDRTQRAVGL